MSLIGLTKIDRNDIKKAIDDSLRLVDYTFAKNLQKVVIKFNACYYWDYSTGQTTDPRFVSSLIELIREKTSTSVDIVLVESDASAMKCKYAFRFLGYEKLANESNVRLVNLSEEAGETVTVECDSRTHQFVIPKILQEADLCINLPKIKYAMKGIELTCALKNIYGCNPFPQKSKYHSQLGNVIVALNKAMPFQLCIVDGNIVSGIKPRKLGLVMASMDPVAIDAASARIAGINPLKIKYLKLAAKEGVGSLTYKIRGESLNQFRALYPKKTLKKKLMGLAYVLMTRLRLAKKLGLS
jgi:uncharacterized protein (DUF362 family)